jgi:glycosyltransferase involved in cell wall biosynthesis
MKQSIEQNLSTNNFDLIIASEFGTASYGPYFQGTKAIFEDPELGVFYEAFTQAPSVTSRFRNGLTWLKYRDYLARLLQNYNACTVVSEQERELVHRAAPGYKKVDVVPNCISLSDYIEVHETPEPNSLIFTGSFRYSANHDAMVWFMQEVYPYLSARVPGLNLTVTGDHANLPLPHRDKVALTGFVDDVRPLIASSWVSLAPLRVGGGTRLKILEAMALGTPVVATSKGAEGLDVQDDRHLLIANSPSEYAEAIIRLLQEPGLRQRIVSNAYQLVQEKYEWSAVLPHFLKLVENAAVT